MFNSELRNEIPIPTLGRACSAFLNWAGTHRPGMEGNFTTALKGPEPALPWLVRILSSSLNHLSQLYGVRIKPCPVLSDIWERSVPPQPPRSALWVEVSLLMSSLLSEAIYLRPLSRTLLFDPFLPILTSSIYWKNFYLLTKTLSNLQ